MMIDTEKLNAALNNSKVIAVLARFGSEETALTFVLLISFAMLALSAGVQIGLCEAAHAFQPDMSTCIPHKGDFVLMPGMPGTPVDYGNAWNNANLGMAVGTMGIVLGGVSLWAKGVMRSPA